VITSSYEASFSSVNPPLFSFFGLGIMRYRQNNFAGGSELVVKSLAVGVVDAAKRGAVGGAYSKVVHEVSLALSM
jgi:hypothetical protein